ncbi:MAG: hypothetical protein IOD12_08280 [Silvanigrellales bacterium]|nr:hypothetical protein [Silvanigrellales bacterium]
MSSRIVVVENESWKSLSAARQDLIESGLKLVAGARRQAVPSLLEALSALGSGQVPGSAVFLFPVALPAQEARALALVKALEKAMPFQGVFGLVVLLVGTEGFSPDSLMDSFWVDVLDGLYDIAIPTQVVAWHDASAGVEAFQLAAAASSLLRELDSLEELARLGALLSQLEARMDQQMSELEFKPCARDEDPS